MPGLARLPSHLQSLATPVYSVSQLTLSVFTEPDLRPSLSSQSLCGLSIDSRIDTDCVYALLPSGMPAPLRTLMLRVWCFHRKTCPLG